MGFPIHPVVILPVWKNVQNEEFDCGPAVLRTIAETVGVKNAEKIDFFKIANTNARGGTSNLDMLKALKELKIKHDFVNKAEIADIEEAVRQMKLCLVEFQAWGKGGRAHRSLRASHYAIIFGFDERRLYL